MRKKIIIVVLIIIFIILLIPRKLDIDDGGSVEYRAILYSATNYHSIKSDDGFNSGIKVKILGKSVLTINKRIPKK